MNSKQIELAKRLSEVVNNGGGKEEFLVAFNSTHLLYRREPKTWEKMFWVLMDFSELLSQEERVQLLTSREFAPRAVCETATNFLKDYSSDVCKLGFQNRHLEIVLEISTICNLSCHFCTYRKIVNDKRLPVKAMSASEAEQHLYRLRVLTILAGMPSFRVNFSPTGLGEPLFNAEWDAIMERARTIFPFAMIKIHTNGIILTADVIEKIARSKIDAVIVSLRYFDRARYHENTGTDCREEVHYKAQQLISRLKESSIQVYLQYFTVDENDFDIISKDWGTRIGRAENVVILHQEFLHLTENANRKATDELAPCQQLWQVLSISVDGTWFPCCLALWDDVKNTISIGSQQETAKEIISKITQYRKAHIDGRFSKCLNCGALFDKTEENKRVFHSLEEEAKHVAADIARYDIKISRADLAGLRRG